MKKWILIIAALVIFIDQISKFLVTYYMGVGDYFVVIHDFFLFRYIRNTGAAWGFFSNGTIFLIIISFIFLYFLIKYVTEERHITKFNVLYYGLVFGGLIGNLIDRLFRGYVVDFFSFNIFGYDFPIFNVADIFIVVGVFLFALDSFLGGDNCDNRGRKNKD